MFRPPPSAIISVFFFSLEKKTYQVQRFYFPSETLVETHRISFVFRPENGENFSASFAFLHPQQSARATVGFIMGLAFFQGPTRTLLYSSPPPLLPWKEAEKYEEKVRDETHLGLLLRKGDAGATWQTRCLRRGR